MSGAPVGTPALSLVHRLLVVGVALLLVALVAVPLARLVEVVLTGDNDMLDTLTSERVRTALRNSLVLGVSVTCLAVVAGLLLALLTERSSAPGRRVLRAVVVVQLLMPPFVLGFAWSEAYGPAGFIDDYVGSDFPGLLGPIGVITVVTVEAIPLAYLVLVAGLATRAEPDLERAARAAGASSWTTFQTITLPLLRAPLAAAAALVFVSAISAFAVVAVLGTPGGFATMTTRIYQDLALSGAPAAFESAVLLALVLVAIVLVVVGTSDALLSRAAAPSRAATTGASAIASPPSAGARSAAVVAWVYTVFSLAVPMLVLVLTALTRAVGLPPTPANWSLSNLDAAFAGPTWEALGRSMLLAATSATLLVILGLVIVALEPRQRGRRWSTLVTLSFAIPGSTLAVAVLIAYGRWIGGTILIILIAYLAKFWAVAHRPIAGAADRLSGDLSWAARVSGASHSTATRTVVLPPLVPALAIAWALVAQLALHELTMSSLLYGPGTQTLAVVVLNLQELGDVGSTAALGLVMMVLTVVLALPLLILVPRRRRSSAITPQPIAPVLVTR